jgi:hypothetical protein fgonA2_02319
MNRQEIQAVIDGQTVDKDFVNSWEIIDYCNQFNGNLTISFVGAIIKKEKILFSFPKHYRVEDDEYNQILCMKQILYILSKSKSSYGSFDMGVKGEFPIKAYLGILVHYKKYGLYLSNEQYYKNGYAGNADWNRTVNKSNKIIQKKGIIFFPFILKKFKDKSVFISECMNYVLSDASKYKDFINAIMPYEHIHQSNMFNNLQYVLNELKKIKNSYFKDIEKRLISNLIEYIEWKSTTRDTVLLITLKFEKYWEVMINEYLNESFCGIYEDQILWGKNNQYTFTKPAKEPVESAEKILQYKSKKPYQIQYDHYFEDANNKKIILFDSKYFNAEADQLNYKQLFYNYHLKQKHPDYYIYNGLLLPTEKNYYTKIHIDRTDLDEIKIVEHYINLNLVVNHYVRVI